MRIERAQNATRNIIFGVFLKVYQILFPFLMRTVMIYSLGVQYLGLNSLYASILQVLNLAELGVGSAMVFSMYEPIAHDDRTKVCALMRLYRLYYRAIGLIIAVIGLLVLPVVPKLISGEIPSDVNVYVLYLINLSSTVLSYWLFAYKNSILQAHQRNDIISKVTLLTSTFQYILQIGALWLFKSYYLYILVQLLTQAITNVLTAIIASKIYPDFVPSGKLDVKEVHMINQRIKDLFTSKVGAVIVNSADSIVISAFLGLTVLAVYQNYYFILTSVIGIVEVVFTACTAGIGNSLIVEDQKKNFADLKKFTYIISVIAGSCSSCLLNMYQPFIKVWLGENMMLDYAAVICFCVYYYVYEINRILNTYKDAGGIWHKDRFRPLVTALANLMMNLLLVRFWGVYGVILSTVLSMLLVGMPWIIKNIFSTLFARDESKQYVVLLLKYAGVSLLGCVLTFFLCSYISIDGFGGLATRLFVCMVVVPVLFYLFFRKTEEFIASTKLIIQVLKTIQRHGR